MQLQERAPQERRVSQLSNPAIYVCGHYINCHSHSASGLENPGFYGWGNRTSVERCESQARVIKEIRIDPPSVVFQAARVRCRVRCHVSFRRILIRSSRTQARSDVWPEGTRVIVLVRDPRAVAASRKVSRDRQCHQR